MGYKITRDYIKTGNSRPARKGNKRLFLVAHDTGNAGSTAHGNRSYFNNNQPKSGAHTFIDDSYILEIVPLDEIVYNVRYNVKRDNKKYGDDANDAAIGVELCWGGNIDFNLAYQRYVWYFAYLCKKFGLNPKKDIVSHSYLDPSRRDDPQNALNRYGVSWNKFIKDVNKKYKNKEISTNAKKKILRKNDQGSYVEKIQKKLIKAGYKLPKFGADGHYGDETVNAVKELQKDYDAQIDGIFGKEAKKCLKKAMKGELTMDQYNKLNKRINKLEKQLDDKIDRPSNSDKAGASHKENVEWAKENNISDGSRPRMYATREQVMSMLKNSHDEFEHLLPWMYDAIVKQFEYLKPYLTKPERWKKDLENNNVPTNELLGMFILTMLRKEEVENNKEEKSEEE